MAGLFRQAIKTLQAGAQNSLIIGVVIHSLNTKAFDASRMRYGTGQRAVWTFTLRDSEEDIINVTVWGAVDFVNRLYSTYTIGTVVEVINAKITERRNDDQQELFVPSTSCPYSLTINEGVALIQAHNAPSKQTFERLLHLPTRKLDGLQSLKFVLENIEDLRDCYVDVLVVVTFISETRNVVTRDGRNLVCRNFGATDASTNETVSLILWEAAWVHRAEMWEPKSTVLLLTDARVAYDNYKKKIVLTIARKTLIIEDPDITQTAEIRSALSCYNSDTMLSDSFVIPNLKSIKTVMTIREITEKLNKGMNEATGNPDERVQFVVIVEASVTEMNLNDSDSSLISARCAVCKRLIQNNLDSCMNLDCPAGNGNQVPSNVISLNIKVNLKDDTGYLIGCRLSGSTAEQVLGCSALEFQTMNLAEREDLKWKFVLEPCEIYLHVLGPTATFPRALYNILSLRRIRATTEEHEYRDVENNSGEQHS